MKSVLKRYWFWFGALMLSSVSAFAEEGAAAAAHGSSGAWAAGISVGVGMGIAVFGGALGQGRIGAAFMEGVSRNPGAQKPMFVPMILALVFVETLVLFAFLTMQLLLGHF